MKIPSDNGPTFANRVVIALRWIASTLASDPAMIYTDPRIGVEREVKTRGEGAPEVRIHVEEAGNEGDVRGAVMAWVEAVQTHAGAVTSTLTESADEYEATITVRFGDPELPIVHISAYLARLGGKRRVVESEYAPLLPPPAA